MPVITEDVVQTNQARKCDSRKCDSSTVNGYIENKSCLKKEKENTGIGFNGPASDYAIRHMNSSSKQQQLYIKTKQQQQHHSAKINTKVIFVRIIKE